MAHWHVTLDPKAKSHRHHFDGGRGHALLSQLARNAFEVVGVSASIWQQYRWWKLHEVPNISAFEAEHSVETERQAYNERLLLEVQGKKVTLRGVHRGASDLFVPVVIDGDVTAIVVAGPFILERPTSSEILERWWGLTGRSGELSDPEFAQYVRQSLATLVLEGELSSKFEGLLQCFAELLAERGAADELASRTDELRVALQPVRQAERTWEVVRDMIDERSSRVWGSPHRAHYLRSLGLPRLADHVAVGLAVSTHQNSDPVDEAVRLDRFQRQVVSLASALGGAIAGRIEDRGVILLSASSGSREGKRQNLLDLVDRVRRVARRDYDLSVHFGVGPSPPTAALNHSYQAAFAAAESALGRGVRIADVDESRATQDATLRSLRRDLARALDERPGVVEARFERYLEAVRSHAGDRLDTARAYLDAGFERMVEALIATGNLDPKSVGLLTTSLDRAAAGARNVQDLFSSYRKGATDLGEAVEHPVRARQGRSLRGALDHIHQHYTERLQFRQVARLSGFEPKYFSALFKKRQKTTFERYVLALRVERAKQLLSATQFDVARVARLSGFGAAHYFCRVFRREVKRTPLEFRSLRLYPSERKAKRKR